MIAALFVQSQGVYFGLDDVDPWDVERNALLYAGPHSVVAHPPCSRWCRLAKLTQHRYGHKVGDDGGCFAFALAAVRQWGGVLEHPAFSFAWPKFGLQKPQAKGWTRDMLDGGWVCEVSQAAYGHRAEKLTWLYYAGANPPAALRWDRPRASHQVSQLNTFVRANGQQSGGALPGLSKREASRTPIEFRQALIDLARGAA